MIKSVNRRKIIELLPPNCILLESEGPFKNKYDIDYINDLIISISKLKRYKIENMYDVLRSNFKSILERKDT